MDMDNIVGSIPEFDLETLMASLTFEMAIICVAILMISAFFSLRIFNIYISAFCSITFGYAGYFVALLLLDEGIMPVVEGIKLEFIIGFAAAILGFALSAIIYKIALFLSAGSIAFWLAYTLLMPMLMSFGFPLEDPVSTIVSIVIGGIVGILFAALFKPLYIFLTSIGGMAGVGGILALTIFPEFNLTYLIIGLVAGAIIGIIPMIYQFKKNAEQA